MAINRVKVTKAAEKFVRQNRMEDAIRQYRRLLDETPGDVGLLNKVGDLYRRAGQIPRALSCFRRIADDYRDKGFAPKAIAMYKKVAKLDPEDVGSREELAILFSDAGLVREAVTHLREAATQLAAKGESERALELESRALELCPEDWSGLSRQAEKLLAAGERERAIATYLRAAQGMADGGRLDDAVNCCEAAIAASPGDPEPVVYMVRLLLRNQRGEDAANALLALMDDSQAPHLQALYGEALLSQGRLEEARTALEAAAESTFADGDMGYRLSLLRLNLREGRADEVESTLAHVVELLREKADDEGALQLLQEVLAEQPGVAATRSIILSICQRSPASPALIQETLKALISDLEQSGDPDKKLVEAYNLLGRLCPGDPHISQKLAAMGQENGVIVQPPAAVAEVTEYVQLDGEDGSEVDPDFVSEHLVEADVFIKYGLHAKAAAHLTRIVERYPRTLVAHQRLVELYAETGQAEGGVVQAVQLAEAYRLRGALSDARQVLLRAQESQPDNPSLATMLESLAPDSPLPAYRPTYERTAVALPASAVEEAGPPPVQTSAPAEPVKVAPQVSSPVEMGAEDEEEILELELEASAELTPELQAPEQSSATPASAVEPPRQELDFFDLAEAIERELADDEPQPISGAVVDDGEDEVDPVTGIRQAIDMQVGTEDHQTHYQLGIAFKEMGLLDESIGAFQQAAKDPDLFLICCSMLGLCFREKGMPRIAEKWYRKGLDYGQASNQGATEVLGLLYDLGTLHLEAGQQEEARNCFTDVYASDAGYRDVAARLRLLALNDDAMPRAEG